MARPAHESRPPTLLPGHCFVPADDYNCNQLQGAVSTECLASLACRWACVAAGVRVASLVTRESRWWSVCAIGTGPSGEALCATSPATRLAFAAWCRRCEDRGPQHAKVSERVSGAAALPTLQRAAAHLRAGGAAVHAAKTAISESAYSPTHRVWQKWLSQIWLCGEYE